MHWDSFSILKSEILHQWDMIFDGTTLKKKKKQHYFDSDDMISQQEGVAMW